MLPSVTLLINPSGVIMNNKKKKVRSDLEVFLISEITSAEPSAATRSTAQTWLPVSSKMCDVWKEEKKKKCPN